MTSTRLMRATPSAKDVDPSGIKAFLDDVESQGLELHSFMLFRSGAVVAEGFWKPYAPERPHMQHSATKSWTAAAVGLAIEEGYFNLQSKVVDFFPEHRPAEVSENLAAMTVEDLLTMRTGHRSGISGGEWRQMRDSWVAAFLREPVEEAPGKTFIYSSASSYMLSAIVTKVTGQTVSDYLEQRLFRPLKMGPISWDQSPDGLSTGGNGLSCMTEDVMKFGVLHLRNGLWEGRQVLPEQWVREATRNHVEDVWMAKLDGRRFLPRAASGQSGEDKREGYGYQWWMTPHGGYRASGVYGQQCIVFPDRDAVIVFTAALPLGDRRLLAAVWKHLYPALGSKPRDAEAIQSALLHRLGDLRLPDIQGAAHSPLENQLNGRRFTFEPNEDQITEISLQFSRESCAFTLSDHRGTHSITAGLDQTMEGETTMTGNLLHHEYQPDKLRVVARGAWRDDHTFVMSWRFVETAFCDTVVLHFDGTQLCFARSVNTNAGPLERPRLLSIAS